MYVMGPVSPFRNIYVYIYYISVSPGSKEVNNISSDPFVSASIILM